MKNKIKVLMLASEASPFVKVGGLADVVGSLPQALSELDVNIRLVLPLYGLINKKEHNLSLLISKKIIESGGKKTSIKVWQKKINNKLSIYFIDAPKYFKSKEVYSGKNSEKFLFFSLASLAILSDIDFIPDVLHCHDFHTALAIDIVKAGNFDFLKNVKTLYTIHNLNYQGKNDVDILKTGNLNVKSTKILSRDAQNGDINFMVQGILSADLVNTVSKTYAKEITTSFYGAKLERIIRKRKNDLYGVVNGIDDKFFNPKTDKSIYKKYDYKTLKNKIFNKTSLQKELGLEINPKKAMIGIISRLVWQKGLDLILEEFATLDCQFVILGTGQKEYEKNLSRLAKKYPKNFSVILKFDLNLAQNIYAASDIFAMPSRFEPCGLGQLIAMRYGAVPLVRKTGGLADTVNNKNGFVFNDADAESFKASIDKALKMYYSDKSVLWKNKQIAGMTADFSWQVSAKKYLTLYKKLCK